MCGMPKILARTVAEHREQRRAALLEAAASLLRGGTTFTVAEVATQVGLSRSAVYEYYSSAADLIADVVVDELAEWADILRDVTSAVPASAGVDAWVGSVLQYVADGRHALIRAAASIDLPATRRAQVQGMHRELIAPLQAVLVAQGHVDPARVARYVWGVTESAIRRIEADDAEAADETAAVLAFIHRGLATQA